MLRAISGLSAERAQGLVRVGYYDLVSVMCCLALAVPCLGSCSSPPTTTTTTNYYYYYYYCYDYYDYYDYDDYYDYY